jgi:SAM-dependent methyltransferase
MPGDTADESYTAQLLREGGAWWKRLFDVQRPYRWNIRRLAVGFILDIGCGLGRNLAHVDGHGVGVDHNPASVRVSRARGLEVLTPDEFSASKWARPGTFDSVLLSHVAEHMTRPQVIELLSRYLPYLKSDGRLIVITPQERGFESDATHVEFMDEAALRDILRTLGFEKTTVRSFPLPRMPFGKIFRYNEFVAVGFR